MLLVIVFIFSMSPVCPVCRDRQAGRQAAVHSKRKRLVYKQMNTEIKYLKMKKAVGWVGWRAQPFLSSPANVYHPRTNERTRRLHQSSLFSSLIICCFTRRALSSSHNILRKLRLLLCFAGRSQQCLSVNFEQLGSKFSLKKGQPSRQQLVTGSYHQSLRKGGMEGRNCHPVLLFPERNELINHKSIEYRPEVSADSFCRSYSLKHFIDLRPQSSKNAAQ